MKVQWRPVIPMVVCSWVEEDWSQQHKATRASTQGTAQCPQRCLNIHIQMKKKILRCSQYEVQFLSLKLLLITKKWKRQKECFPWWWGQLRTVNKLLSECSLLLYTFLCFFAALFVPNTQGYEQSAIFLCCGQLLCW